MAVDEIIVSIGGVEFKGRAEGDEIDGITTSYLLKSAHTYRIGIIFQKEKHGEGGKARLILCACPLIVR